MPEATKAKIEANPIIERLRLKAAEHPDCPVCQKRIETGNFIGPGHNPSQFCRSGKRNHCSCSTCY